MARYLYVACYIVFLVAHVCMYACMYVTGTSQATILALSAARVKLFGTDVRKIGIRDLPEIRVYVSSDVHSCINKGV